MKSKLVLCLLCFYSLNCYAQETHMLGVFRSFPTGKFGSSDLEGGGFAKPGWGFFVANNSKPKVFPKWLSFVTRFSYQKNQIDTDLLAQKFTEALGYETHISEASYQPIMFLGGPHFEIGLRKSLTLQLKTGFGVMFTQVDAFSIVVRDSQGGILIDDVLDASGNIPFAYLGGLQLRQTLGSRISLGLFSDFSSAKGKMGSKFGKIKTKPTEFDISTISAGLSLRLDI